MGRKYIDDLGIKLENTPQGWNENDPRQEEWAEDRKVYGFDERETWSLDFSLALWFYERLSMYNEITEDKIVKTYHTFEYKGETLTQQDCIDRMLDNLKYYLTENEYDNAELYWAKAEEIYELLALCHNVLWW